MSEVVLAVYAFNQNYAQKLAADLADDQMCAQPVPGRTMNHAAFLLGHLAWAEDSALALIEKTPKLGAEWKNMFSMHAKPESDRTGYPPKETLVQTLDEVHKRLSAAYAETLPEVLAQPAPERLRGRFATVGIAVAGLMTAHRAMHLGQLSAWRRALGLPGVF